MVVETEKSLRRQILFHETQRGRLTFWVWVSFIVFVVCLGAIVAGLVLDSVLTHTQSCGFFVPGILGALVSLVAGIFCVVARYDEDDKIRELNNELEDVVEMTVRNWN